MTKTIAPTGVPGVKFVALSPGARQAASGAAHDLRGQAIALAHMFDGVATTDAALKIVRERVRNMRRSLAILERAARG